MAYRTPARSLCLIYAVILLGAAAINYVLGLTDDQGLALGIFALDPSDDALHLVSALWALFAGLRSQHSAQVFLILFSAACLGDGVAGMLAGWGYLDFGFFANDSLGADFGWFRIAANLPPIALGAVALVAGLVSVRR